MLSNFGYLFKRKFWLIILMFRFCFFDLFDDVIANNLVSMSSSLISIFYFHEFVRLVWIIKKSGSIYFLLLYKLAHKEKWQYKTSRTNNLYFSIN